MYTKDVRLLAENLRQDYKKAALAAVPLDLSQ
jgi:hypothetical protein